MWRAEHRLEATVDLPTLWRVCVDLPTWPHWQEAVSTCRFDGALAKGRKGVMCFRSGERLPFTVEECQLERSLVCRARSLGSRITFRLALEPSERGVQVSHGVEIQGLTGWFVARTLGRRLKEGLAASTRRLVYRAAAEEGIS